MATFANIDGTTIHYQFRFGSGRAIVFSNSLGTGLLPVEAPHEIATILQSMVKL